MILLPPRVFGRWTAISTIGQRSSKVMCRCACGIERMVSVNNLMSGKSQSCGCLKREVTASLRRSHGVGYGDYRYSLWQTIKGKCRRPSHHDWAYYGGSSIGMHAAWVDDYMAFARFLDSELGPRPEGLTLDRIDNSQGYVPGNLRWATRREQASNRRPRNSVKV